MSYRLAPSVFIYLPDFPNLCYFSHLQEIKSRRQRPVEVTPPSYNRQRPREVTPPSYNRQRPREVTPPSYNRQRPRDSLTSVPITSRDVTKRMRGVVSCDVTEICVEVISCDVTEVCMCGGHFL
ncbi:hypothetical protein ACOMHN_042582 [Nucella lapillus]